MSWHFRGPLQLKQFAFYIPGTSTSSSKRQVNRPSRIARRHGHGHDEFHVRDKAIRTFQENHIIEEKRAVGDLVVATINGVAVSWTNEYAGPGAEATPAPEVASTPVAAPWDGSAGSGASSAVSVAESAIPSVNAGSGNWGRQAYYDAENQTADGLVFLNHNGGQGSGVFDE